MDYIANVGGRNVFSSNICLSDIGINLAEEDQMKGTTSIEKCNRMKLRPKRQF